MTDKRDEIMRFITAFIAENQYPPSVREIGEAVGLSSTSTVHFHLRQLQDEGRLSVRPNSPRTLRVLEAS